MTDSVIRLKNNISSLEVIKRNIRSEPVSDITHRMRKTGFIKWVKDNVNGGKEPSRRITEQLDFIYFLLSSGYLSTDYMSFRSVFMPGGLTENDNAFIKSVMAGNEAVASFALPLDNIPNVVARLKKLGVIERENVQHPGIIRWLLDNDRETLIENSAVLLSQAGSQHTVHLLQLIQEEFSTEVRLRYLEVFMQGEKVLKRLLTHLRDSDLPEYVQDMTACLLCLSKYKSIWYDPEIKLLVCELITKAPLILASVPQGHTDDFLDIIITNKITVSHIPLVSDSEHRRIIDGITHSGLFEYSSSNLENIYISLSQNKDGLLFSRNPLQCLESLQIPAITDIIQVNINKFVSSLFIESTETDRIPQLLNSKGISLSSAELIISRMDFCIERIESIENTHELWIENHAAVVRTAYSLLLSHDRIHPSLENLVHLLNDDVVDPAHDLVHWVNDKCHDLSPYNIVFSSVKSFDKFLDKFICSLELSEEALQTVMRNIDITITVIPKTIPLRNAEILCSEQKLASTIHVFTDLFNAFYSDKINSDRMNIMLSNLIAERPVLLLDWPQQIFYTKGIFDTELARILLSHSKIDADTRVRVISWLRKNDPDLTGRTGLLSLQTLSELSPSMPEDTLRLAMLRLCLAAGETDKVTLRAVLNSFADENYHGLLPQERYKKISYTDDLWELAELLSQTGLIQPPKRGSGRDEHKIVIKPVHERLEE